MIRKKGEFVVKENFVVKIKVKFVFLCKKAVVSEPLPFFGVVGSSCFRQRYLRFEKNTLTKKNPFFLVFLHFLTKY